MEERKTKRADLESRRPTFFLIGLVVALALLLAALEFPTTDNSGKALPDMLDDFAQEMDMLPALDPRDMIAAAQTPAAPAKTDELKVVDKQTEQMEKLNAITDMRTVGNGDGANAGNAAADGAQGNADDAPAEPPVAVDANDNPLNFRVVEQLPEFPGGMSAFVKWLTDNLKYPPVAQKNNIQGQVVVSFVINRDGTVADIKIAKSVHYLLDREALRVAHMMPKWKPGIADNKPCRTLFAIPIVFKI